jgi:hypothetical protein
MGMVLLVGTQQLQLPVNSSTCGGVVFYILSPIIAIIRKKKFKTSPTYKMYESGVIIIKRVSLPIKEKALRANAAPIMIMQPIKTYFT